MDVMITGFNDRKCEYNFGVTINYEIMRNELFCNERFECVPMHLWVRYDFTHIYENEIIVITFCNLKRQQTKTTSEACNLFQTEFFL